MKVKTNQRAGAAGDSVNSGAVNAKRSGATPPVASPPVVYYPSVGRRVGI